jgi:glutathione S-transferase
MTSSDSQMRKSRVTCCSGYSSGTEVVLHTKGTLAFSAVRPNKFPVRYTPHPSILLPTSYLILLFFKVAIERFRKETYRVFGVLEIRLSGKYTGEPRDYLVGAGKGKYSIADIATWPWVKNYPNSYSEEDMKAFPHLLKWLARVAERPAVKRGTGDKYKKTA